MGGAFFEGFIGTRTNLGYCNKYICHYNTALWLLVVSCEDIIQASPSFSGDYFYCTFMNKMLWLSIGSVAVNLLMNINVTFTWSQNRLEQPLLRSSLCKSFVIHGKSMGKIMHDLQFFETFIRQFMKCYKFVWLSCPKSVN